MLIVSNNVGIQILGLGLSRFLLSDSRSNCEYRHRFVIYACTRYVMYSYVVVVIGIGGIGCIVYVVSSSFVN